MLTEGVAVGCLEIGLTCWLGMVCEGTVVLFTVAPPTLAGPALGTVAEGPAAPALRAIDITAGKYQEWIGTDAANAKFFVPQEARSGERA